MAAIRAARSLSVLALVLTLSACAAKEAPTLPSAPKYPEFSYPIVPFALSRSPGADAVERGWRYLQNDDLRNADREFAAALMRAPDLYPAHAATGYVALARHDHERALAGFDAALRRAPMYVPALVGRGQTLLALNRDEDALAAFEAALAADGSLTDLQRRVEVLRFRSVQDLIEAARKAAGAGRQDEAREAYRRAVAASPDSAFLYRELGLVQRKQGDEAAALESLRRAAELDPLDSVSWTQIGEILERRADFAGAEAAYRKAFDVDPAPELTARIAAAATMGREAGLPAEFRAIAATPQVTRGDLAALIGVNLEAVVRAAPGVQAVITDTRGHWAAAWIAEVARARVIEAFENHTFQPRTRLRHVDLAIAVSRIVALLAASRPDLRTRIAERRPIADVGPTHLNYQDVARAVASGVMALDAGGRFDVGRPVSGAEALEAIARLRALADSSR